jgi:glycosyltransferase involved in cell wall biosynthesis
MRVLIIGAANSNHTKRWANAMVERGHDVLLACRPDQTDDMGDLLPKVSVKCLKFGGQTYSYFLNVISIRKIYNEFKPNVVNAHYASGYGLLARLAKLKPLVISVWGSDIFEYPYKNKFNRSVLVKNLNYCDAIASTSFAMADEVKKVLGNPDKDVTVTPFGVDINKFSPEVTSRVNDRPIIGIVKYLHPIYDIPLLINAFAIVYNTSDVKPLLHIYGGGPLLSELKELVKKLDIEEAVTFFGTIPNAEVSKALKTFDIFVNCSVRESFGVAIVEAMACGLPVVATDTAGFREVVDDEVTGFVLKDRRPDTMAEKLRILLNDKELRNKMGQAGRAKVLKYYNWQDNISVMEDLFMELNKER